MNTLHVDEREDRVVVTLDRPAQRNAINAEMIDETASGLWTPRTGSEAAPACGARGPLRRRR